MTGKSARRLSAALVGRDRVAAALGPSAGAWIPSVEADEPLSRVTLDRRRAGCVRARREAASAEAPGRLVGAGCVRARREARSPGRVGGGEGSRRARRLRPSARSRLGRDGVTTLVVIHHKRCHARDGEL